MNARLPVAVRETSSRQSPSPPSSSVSQRNPFFNLLKILRFTFTGRRRRSRSAVAEGQWQYSSFCKSRVYTGKSRQNQKRSILKSNTKGKKMEYFQEGVSFHSVGERGYLFFTSCEQYLNLYSIDGSFILLRRHF